MICGGGFLWKKLFMEAAFYAFEPHGKTIYGFAEEYFYGRHGHPVDNLEIIHRYVLITITSC